MNLSKDDITPQIKDLLQHLTPMINMAGSSENTLEMLLYLAEMDPTFHKIELVKFIRQEIRSNLSNKIEGNIDKYLKEHEKKLKDENPLENLTRKITKDNSFLNFKAGLQLFLEQEVQKFSLKAEKNLFTDLLAENENEIQNSVSSPPTSTETSLNSSLNQSSFLFLHPAQYINIAESLQKKQNLEHVRDSLNLLLAVTPGEPVYQENWDSLKKGLKECLQVNHDEIFIKALRFHVRLLTSQVQIAIKEGYLNLLDAISSFWLSKKLMERVPSKNERSVTVEDDSLLMLMKLLSTFMKDLPLLWIRYPSNYTSEIIEATFNVYVNPRDDKKITFLDVISLVDPKANWFRAWTHNQFGRKRTFQVLKSNPIFLSHSVSYCIAYVQKTHDYPIKVATTSVQPELSGFYSFNHSLQIILTILKYSEGRELFPVNDHTNDDHISIKKMLQILAHVCDNSKQKMVTKSILINLFNFCHLKENLCTLVCDVGVVDILIQVVQRLEQTTKPKEFKVWFAKAILNFFISINSTASGHEFLITGKLPKVTSKTYLTANIQTPAQIILALTRACLARRWIEWQIKELSVQLSSSLLRSPLGRHLFLSHPLFNSLVRSLQETFNIKYNDLISARVEASPDSRPFSLDYKHAKSFLETLIASHKGIITLEKNSVLMPVLETALPAIASRGEMSLKLLNRLVCSEQGKSK